MVAMIIHILTDINYHAATSSVENATTEETMTKVASYATHHVKNVIKAIHKMEHLCKCLECHHADTAYVKNVARMEMTLTVTSAITRINSQTIFNLPDGFPKSRSFFCLFCKKNATLFCRSDSLVYTQSKE